MSEQRQPDNEASLGILANAYAGSFLLCNANSIIISAGLTARGWVEREERASTTRRGEKREKK